MNSNVRQNFSVFEGPVQIGAIDPTRTDPVLGTIFQKYKWSEIGPLGDRVAQVYFEAEN